MKTTIASLVLLHSFVSAFAQSTTASEGLLTRRYKEGELLTYHMKGANDNWRYEALAAGVVKKGSDGRFVEEYAWSGLMSNGAAVMLPPASINFRQTVSLDPGIYPAAPDLSDVHPMLVGPITDLLTFYVDFWLAARTGSLNHAGDHRFLPLGTPGSWADGIRVVLGQSSVDFDMTLGNIDQSRGIIALTVRHVPPQQPQEQLPAAWMQKPVADTPNNWVQVTKQEDRFQAAVGKETFEVHLDISLVNGEILSGTMENVVDEQERDCQDEALSHCGPPRNHPIRRHIELSLDRSTAKR